MAYKVVCTKCGKPVKVVVAKTGYYWDVRCACQENDVHSKSPDWKIQESGVIPVTSRQKYCSGCEDNFYNGNNTVGVKACWNLKKAKVVKKKKIGIDDEPPWEHQPIVTTLSCYHCKGYVFLTDPKRLY
jgi:hypothetical protein